MFTVKTFQLILTKMTLNFSQYNVVIYQPNTNMVTLNRMFWLVILTQIPRWGSARNNLGAISLGMRVFCHSLIEGKRRILKPLCCFGLFRQVLKLLNYSINIGRFISLVTILMYWECLSRPGISIYHPFCKAHTPNVQWRS